MGKERGEEMIGEQLTAKEMLILQIELEEYRKMPQTCGECKHFHDPISQSSYCMNKQSIPSYRYVIKEFTACILGEKKEFKPEGAGSAVGVLIKYVNGKEVKK